MNKDYVKFFAKKIYDYCDKHVGEKVLFPVFMNFWREDEYTIKKKDLACLTSKIIRELVSEKILKEIPKDFESVYGMYEILEHENFKL